MFAALGRLAYRRARWVLALAGLFTVFAVVWGGGVLDRLTAAGFTDEGSESAQAQEELTRTFGRQDADVLVLYSSGELTVRDAAFREAVETSLGELSPSLVSRTVTYWDGGAETLVSDDGSASYAVLTLAGETEDDRVDDFADVEAALGTGAGGLSIELGGPAALNHGLSEQVADDIRIAEMIAMPLLLILLLVVFGTLVAASMPLLVGLLAILGSFVVLHAFSLVTDVSIFSVNIVTMLGLGLAIDYSLFIVSRYREELRAGRSVADAVERTLSTAGRTVAFSGLVVGISLLGLMLFPLVFLRSMGMGGLAAVLIAMLGSLTVLPAVLSLLGRRIESVRMPWRRRATAGGAGGADGARHAVASAGPWYRLARSVMRRPVSYLVVIVAALLILGLPFRNVEFGAVDERVMPEGAEPREVSEQIDRGFPTGDQDAVEVVVTGTPPASLAAYRAELGGLPGVESVRPGPQDAGTALLLVRHGLSEFSPAALDLVEQIREVPAPQDGEVLVGGSTAELADQLDGVGERLPWMIGFIAVVTFVVLFMAFGSLVLPLKALVANTLSLTASFGAIVWIFQYGHFADWLGFTPTGTIDANQPVLMFAVAFGLSMDYEVFLLSRIREEWDRTGNNTEAVAAGLQRTGSIITSAALLLIIVVGSFATSGITFIKMIGLGLLIAIAVDAVLVRTLLVPSAMRLLGRANWWAPAPLARFWERYGHRAEVPGRKAGHDGVPDNGDGTAASPRASSVTGGRG